MTYTAKNNVPFNVRLVTRGMNYGLNQYLTHDEDQPMVEFYDARYPHTKWGQFVSRYYLHTLTESGGGGLDLDSGIPDWTIDADTLQTMLHDVQPFV